MGWLWYFCEYSGLYNQKFNCEFNDLFIIWLQEVVDTKETPKRKKRRRKQGRDWISFLEVHEPYQCI